MQSGKRKGQLNILPYAALSVTVFIIIVAMGSLILTGFNDSTDNADAVSVLDEGQDAMSDFAGWTSTLVVIVVAGVVLSIILGLFVVKRGGGGMA